MLKKIILLKNNIHKDLDRFIDRLEHGSIGSIPKHILHDNKILFLNADLADVKILLDRHFEPFPSRERKERFSQHFYYGNVGKDRLGQLAVSRKNSPGKAFGFEHDYNTMLILFCYDRNIGQDDPVHFKWISDVYDECQQVRHKFFAPLKKKYGSGIARFGDPYTLISRKEAKALRDLERYYLKKVKSFQTPLSKFNRSVFRRQKSTIAAMLVPLLKGIRSAEWPILIRTSPEMMIDGFKERPMSELADFIEAF